MPDARRSRSRRARRRAATLACGVLVLLPAGLMPASAQTTTGGPIRFEAGPDTVLELEDGRRFLDTVELRRGPGGGLVLVNELSMDAYLSGVAEMPPRWHGEALKAQAVAARTYAWRSIQRGAHRSRGYDICGTVDCQVFTGTRVVEESSFGHRWRAAVEATSGEVLLEDDGTPILARYFSTSGGRTLPNELVFPDSGARPYLVGTEDPDDEISPYHRWEARFSREELDDVLSRGETLAAAVPVAEITRDGSVHDPHAEVVVTGEDGTTVRVGAQQLRRFVSAVAPQRHPERFPGPRLEEPGRLPATLPSSRFGVEVGDDEVVFSGLGWGHGVGMGQYGAHGKALRGVPYDDILASYYGGLRPESPDGVPGRVRVGLDVSSETRVRAEGPVRIVAGDDEVTTRGLGGWEVVLDGDALSLRPPEERDAELEVGPTVAAAGLGGRDHVAVETTVNKPVELQLEVVDAEGEPILRRHLGVADAGTHSATWRFEDAAGDRVAAGTYGVALLAVDEHEASDGEHLDVEVDAAPDRQRSADGSGWLAGLLGDPIRLGAVLVGLLVAVATTAALRRSRRP